MTVTAAQIKAQLITGVYPDNTLNADNIYDYEQYQSRRKYPSCEIIVVQPESTTETARETSVNTAYEIKLYTKNLGIMTDEVATQSSIEGVILSLIEAFTLQNFKIVLESKSWSRQQISKEPNHPSYLLSVLKITVRQVKPATLTPTGTLSFRHLNSIVDNNPNANYTYSNVFDVDMMQSYNDVEESFVNNRVKRSFAGDLRGNFICSIMINAADLGTTADKLNKMATVRSTGEKGIYEFQYIDKTMGSTTMTHTFTGEVDRVQYLYRTNEGSTFRLIVRLMSEIIIT